MPHKKRQFLYVFIFITIIFTPVDTVHAREDRTLRSGNHFLWTIESENNTAYLLGSIHMLKRNAYPLPYGFESAYHDSRKVVFETDLDGVHDPEYQNRVMKMGIYPPGKKLSSHISQQTYDLLKSKATAIGMPLSQFEQFKPWLVAQTIASAKIMSLGFDPNLGIDRYFFNRAKKDKKEMIFLESNEYQLNLFAGLSKGKQERLLKQILKDLEVVEENFSLMIDSWEKGDVNRLEAFLKISFEEYPDLYKRLLTDRNKRWVTTIRKLLKQDGVILIIVGAGHLVGKDSVVDLLTKKGYTVRQK